MKKRLLPFFTLVLALAMATQAFALGVGLFDSAGLFTEQEAQNLQDTMDSLVQSGDMVFGMVVVTTNNANGKTARAYADDFYDNGNFGEDGALFLIDMDNREAYISTAGTAIDYFTDQRLNDALDAIMEYMYDGSYAEAALCFLRYCHRYSLAGIPEGQYQYDESTGEILTPPHTGTGINPGPGAISAAQLLLGLAVGLVAGLVAVMVVLQRYRPRVRKEGAYPLHKLASLHLTVSTDHLINSHTTTRRIPPPPPPPSSSGGLGSGVHTSSGGRTHGGGGRTF